MHCTHKLKCSTPAVSGTFFNGGPTLFTRKPMMLLVCHFLQCVLNLPTPVAFKFANLIVIFWHRNVYLCYANILSLHFIFLFLKSNIKN
jgi:hypothetical protein